MIEPTPAAIAARADRQRRGMAIRMAIHASYPLMAGLVLFAGYMLLASSNSDFSSKNMAIVAPSPFKGIDLVYGMLFASLATVFTATAMYLSDLEVMMTRAARVGGLNKIRTARRILTLTLGLDIVLFFSVLFYKQGLQASDACSFKTLLIQAKYHDLVVGLIFAAFIVADLLTYYGLKEALAGGRGGSEDLEEAERDQGFALQQLWLIDIPVLVGAGVSVMAVFFAAGVNHWDSNLLHVSGQVESYLARQRITTLLTCDGRPLSLPEFQESVARIFTAGIAMGYLAAHVLMSQFVFIALNVFHKMKRHDDGRAAPKDLAAS